MIVQISPKTIENKGIFQEKFWLVNYIILKQLLEYWYVILKLRICVFYLILDKSQPFFILSW